MTPRRFNCIQFRKGTLDFNLECIRYLQNDLFKQRYITFNATIPRQDRIYANTHLCRTVFAGIDHKIAANKFMHGTCRLPYNNNNNNVFIFRGLHIKYKHELI